jgi:hypothetical protein
MWDASNPVRYWHSLSVSRIQLKTSDSSKGVLSREIFGSEVGEATGGWWKYTVWSFMVYVLHQILFLKGKVEVYPITSHEGPEGCTLYLTSAVDAGVWSTPLPGHLIPGKDPVPLVQDARWAPGPFWNGAENLTPTGIRSLDRPVCNESLYRLCCPGPHIMSAVK